MAVDRSARLDQSGRWLVFVVGSVVLCVAFIASVVAVAVGTDPIAVGGLLAAFVTPFTFLVTSVIKSDGQRPMGVHVAPATFPDGAPDA